MIKVIPIAETRVNWKLYLSLTETGLGRSVSICLDKKNIPADSTLAFIATLGEMCHENSNPLETIREGGIVLKHASCTFLVITTPDILYEIAIHGQVNLVDADAVNKEVIIAIASNNLEQWRNAIINGCVTTASNNVRQFFNKILQAFDLMGYSRIFEAYSRKPQKDGSFLLQHATTINK